MQRSGTDTLLGAESPGQLTGGPGSAEQDGQTILEKAGDEEAVVSDRCQQSLPAGASVRMCGWWLVACDLGLVACGLWLVACGLLLVACGWCLVPGGLCCLWLMACGLWLMACGLGPVVHAAASLPAYGIGQQDSDGKEALAREACHLGADSLMVLALGNSMC